MVSERDLSVRTRLRELIKTTWDTPYLSVEDRGAAYPVIRHKTDHMEVEHTERLGEKTSFYAKHQNWNLAVDDLISSSMNDLATMGAIPTRMQISITLSNHDETAIFGILRCFVQDCKLNRIAITGGKTRISSYTDISITVGGVVQTVRSSALRPGDWLLGLGSSGLHVEGVPEVLAKLPPNWILNLCTPTENYHKTIMSVLEQYTVSGMKAITYGGFQRVKSLLDRTDAVFKLKESGIAVHHVFDKLHKEGMSDEFMYRNLNCGVGFVIGVGESVVSSIIKDHPRFFRLGRVIPGKGDVRIFSHFSDKEITL